jgi:hypothetical protein
LAVSLSRALADCLDALERGESLDEALERYPRYRNRLLELISVVEVLRESEPGAVPSRHAVEKMKRRVYEARRET